MRIGIVGLLHESNTFLSQTTTLADFERETLLVGESIREKFAGTHHEIGGFLDGLKTLSETSAEPIETVPLFVARALPSGTIDAACWDKLLDVMFDQILAAGPLDGMLLAPHGATVSEKHRDADGHWLSRMREQVGAEMPLVATLDPHANLSPEMVAACNAICAYRTNPHLDQHERGLQAATLIVRTLRGEITPTMHAVFPPLAINIERQMTDESPLKELCSIANDQLTLPGVLSNSIILGFPYADVEEMGSAIIVVTNGDRPLAKRLANELADDLWQNREDYRGRMIEMDDALDQCEKLAGPICLLDMGDNVGGGSSADGTYLAHALHRRAVAKSFVCLFDPDAVRLAEQAGVGTTVTLSVGGKTDTLHGEPFTSEFHVRSFHDGLFRETEVRHGGFSAYDQGQTAILETDTGLTVMLTSRRMVPFSLQQLVSCGLDPASFDILVAKGVNAPLAAYREVCPHFVRVNTPGSTCADMTNLAYEHRRKPLFPLEQAATWTAEST